MQTNLPATQDTETLTNPALVDEYFEKINAVGNEAVIEIGELLDEYKQKAGHGNWLPLLKKLGWSEDQAERFRRSYLFHVNERQLNSATLRNLDQSALFLLTAPSTPKEVREEIFTRAEAGEKLGHGVVKAAIDAAKPSKSPVVQNGHDALPASWFWDHTVVDDFLKANLAKMNDGDLSAMHNDLIKAEHRLCDFIDEIEGELRERGIAARIA